MVNFQDPVQVAHDYTALIRISAFTNGVYLWEFIIALNYEWDVIRGRLPYRRTIWIYHIARLTALMAVIMDMIVNLGNLTNCQPLISFYFIFANLAIASSSLLILIRIFPIWNQDKLAVSLATGVWLANVAFLICGAARIRSSVVDSRCAIGNIQSNKPTFISILVAYIVLLLIMLVGLFRLRSPGVGWLDLGRRLWKQGVIWLVLATIAELLPVAFLCLDLNDAFSIIFIQPTLVTMSIAATRMYRSLVNFYYTADELGCHNGGVGRISSSRAPPPRAGANLVRRSSTTHDRTEVTTDREQRSPASAPAPAPIRRDTDDVSFFANLLVEPEPEPLEQNLREDAENNV